MRSPSDNVKRSPLVRVCSSQVDSGVIFDICNGRQSSISQVDSGVTFDICNGRQSRILQTSCE